MSLIYSMTSFTSAESQGILGRSSVGISCSFQRFSKSVSRTEAIHLNVFWLAFALRSIPCKVRLLISAICVSPLCSRSFLAIESANFRSGIQSEASPGRTAQIGHDNIATFMCYRIIHHASVQSHGQLFGPSALNSTNGWQSVTDGGNRSSGDRSKLHSQYQTGKAKTFQTAEGAGLVDVCCANLLLRLQGLLIKQWGAFSALRGMFILGVDRKSFWICNS